MGKHNDGGSNSTSTNTKKLDPLSYDGGPITPARAKKMKAAIIGLVQSHLELMGKSPSEVKRELMVNDMTSMECSSRLVHLIQFEELKELTLTQGAQIHELV